MSAYHYHAPLDPECPDNHMAEFYEDPITIAYGCGDEMGSLMEDQHRASCKRCQEFGLANIEVTD